MLIPNGANFSRGFKNNWLLFVRIGCKIVQNSGSQSGSQEADMSQQPMNSEITNDDKLWAALGYPIFIIALIMLFIEGKKDRPFIKFHAFQALALNVVLWIVEIILSIIGGIITCVSPFLWLLMLWPAVLAYQGKYFEVPVVTKFLRDQHWIA
jgi:uncharacterized membrane protein